MVSFSQIELKSRAKGRRGDQSYLAVVIGPGQKVLIRIRLGQFFVARVGSGQPSLVWVGKISPKNPKFFCFLLFNGQKKSHWVRSNSTQVKAVSVSYLLQVKSMLGSGRIRAHLYQGCGFNSQTCQQFFDPRLQKNQQGTLSQDNNNLQGHF